MPLFIKSTLKLFLQQLWRLFFRLLILPLYRLYLALKKFFQRYIIHNPYLTERQKNGNVWINSITHIIIISLAVLVIVFNLNSRNSYAEELNKNSLFAQLFSANEDGEEIIEKAPDYNYPANFIPGQKIIRQLAAVRAYPANNEQTAAYKTQITPLIISEKNNGPLNASLQADKLLNTPSANSVAKENNRNTPSATASNRKGLQTYLVKKGDTLSMIAKKFNLSVNTILWANNLSLNSYIRPGDKLTILPVDGITYTVRSGDTVSSIAKRYGSTVNKILAYNQLSSAHKIRVNQKIIVPDGKLGYTRSRRIANIKPVKTIYHVRKKSSGGLKFVWPTTSHRITQYYHWRHHAIDIGNHIGQPIYAPISGRVIHAGWSRGYGYNVVIDNGHGVRTRTAHASKLYVKRGQYVKQGQVVAAVGSTGWSTGPHVHFEIMINGVKVNPLDYF